MALIGLFLAGRAGAQDPSNRIAAILAHPHLEGARVSVSVVDLASGRALFSRHGARRLIPASNAKLVTTAASLAVLGPSFRFRTELFLRGELSAGLLTGDLVLRGSGDPCFSGRFYEGQPAIVLRDWARALAKLGLRRVTGDLLLDTSACTGPAVHPGWPQDQLANWYCAPVASLSLGDNCLEVTVKSSRGRKPAVSLVPALGGLALENTCRMTRTGAHRPWIRRLDGEQMGVSIHGTFKTGEPPSTYTVAMRDPDQVFGMALAEALKRAGIKLEGTIRRSARRVAKPGRPGALHQSALDRVIPVVNKKSQNLFAECLFRALGRASGGGGSFEGGSRAVAGYLKERGLVGAKLVDGSGLARENRLSANDLTTVLRHVWRSPSRKLYLSSLPIAGEDGSLKRRMRSGPARGRVFGKTGYIRSASGLSGYVQTQGGKWLAFSILVNGFQRQGRYISNTSIKGLQDRICQVLAGLKR